MTNAITTATPAPPDATIHKSAASAINPLASESTFLKLLVSQLKNQDPSNPQDGTQFVAQLAQFSGLEQQLQMRQDLDSIKATLQANAAAGTASSASAPQAELVR